MGKSRSSYIKLLYRSVVSHWVVFCVAIFFTSATMANPVLNNVAAGNATVNQSATTTTVNQTSQKAILNWQSFNIGAGEHTHFNQPTNGVALNRISAAQGASQIFGHLSATGQIILMNPAGVHFNSGSFVNVGGLIATTANISNTDFLNGYYNFSQPSSISGAAITNAGHIVAADHGLVALVGGNVTNSGHIQANLGHVVLASGKTFTMSFDGTGLINFAVNSNGNNVTNTGSLIADGGSILVSAKAASGVIDNIINLSGLVQAKSVYEEYGDIVIAGDPGQGVVRIAGNIEADSGNVNITGHDIVLAENAKIDVSGLNDLNGGSAILFAENKLNAHGTIFAKGGALSGDGGFIETSSKGIFDLTGISPDASATNGKPGTWLIDPPDLIIDTGIATIIQAGLLLMNMLIDTAPAGPGNGDIFVTAPITWSSGNTLELSAFRNIEVQQPITNSVGGNLNLRADNTGTGAGTVNFSGPGSVNMAGPVNIFYNPTAYASPINFAPNVTAGTLNAYMLVNNATDVNNIRNNVIATGIYALSKSIDLTSLGTFTPIPTFSGQLDGQNFTLSNLTVNVAGNNVGFFSQLSGATISNLTLSGSVTGYNDVGFLVGDSVNSSFSNVHIASGSTVSGDRQNIGGLVGDFLATTGNNMTISNSSSAANVTANPTVGPFFSVGQVGGFAGQLGESGTGTTTITSSFATGNVTVTGETGSFGVGGFIGFSFGTNIANSYATGNITVGNNTDETGGFIGGYYDNSGSLTNSYSTGNVTTGTNAFDVGGFLGYFGNSNSSIDKAYSTSNVTVGTGSSQIGGFVGNNAFGSIANSYTTGAIVAPSSDTIGGFAGVTDSDDAIIQNSFSTGNISATGSTNVAGFISRISANFGGAGNLTGNFWDADKSGVANGYNTLGAGTPVTNLQGGCLSGTCTTLAITNATNASTVNLSDQSVYTAAGWNFAGTWNNINNQSYPFLQVNYPTARIIAGSTPATAGSTVRLVIDGNIVESTITGNDGSYYFFTGNNLISGINNSITDNTPFLIFIDGTPAAIKANVIGVTPAGGASLSNATALNITAPNTLVIGTGAASSLSTSVIGTTSGGFTADDDVLFTIVGNDLILKPGAGLTTTANTTFDLSTDTVITTTGAGVVNFGGSIAGTGTQSLTITSPNATTLGGGATGLTTLTVNSTGGTTLGGDVTTSGSQSYTGLLTTTGPTTLTMTGTGTNTLSINSGVAGGNTLNVAGNAAGTNTFILESGGSQTYNISTPNSGTYSATGISTSSFSNMQNLTGGSVSNTFVFSGTGSLAGTLDGGVLNPGDGPRNTIDVSALGGEVANLVGGIFGGNITTVNGIINFSDINQLIGNAGTTNVINLPTGKTVSVDYTGFRTGSIGDPLFFVNWTVNGFTTPPPAAINTATNSPLVTEQGYTIGSDVNLIALLAEIFVSDQYNPDYDNKQVYIYPFCQSFSGGFGA